MQLVRKISARTVFGSKTDVLRLVMTDEKKDHPLFVVGGIVTGTKRGSSKVEDEANPVTKIDRPWIALTGRFKAINVRGETFQSAVLFLPLYLVESVESALAIEGDGKELVQIKYTIFAKFDETSATSYVYGATSMLEVDENDVVEQLVSNTDIALIGGSTQAQIAAPKEETPAGETPPAKPDKGSKKA